MIAGGAAARLILFPSDVAEDTSLLGYQLVLCAAAVALAAGVVSRSLERADVADLVVELGEERSDRLRDVLARALGDPTLEVGYWSSTTNGYIDSSGRPLPLPAAGHGRAATTIGTASDPIGILIHHPSLLDDPGLTDSIATAARLASINARLQAEVRAQIVELEASRRRIVTAGDEEHRRLERRLRGRSGTPARSTGGPTPARQPTGTADATDTTPLAVGRRPSRRDTRRPANARRRAAPSTAHRMRARRRRGRPRRPEPHRHPSHRRRRAPTRHGGGRGRTSSAPKRWPTSTSTPRPPPHRSW